MKSDKKQCQNCKNDFVIESDNFVLYKKLNVDPPALCPDCRFRRRSIFRNEMHLYSRICDLCKKSVVSMYHSSLPYVIYCEKCWRSDKWNSKEYVLEYDTNKPFFDQLKELVLSVPKMATFSSVAMGPNINSEYTNFAGPNKDCYLCFNSGPNNENCAYSRGLINSRDIFDAYYVNNSERIYEGIGVHSSSGVSWGQNISNCLDSSYLLNCNGCQNCFGCVNLRHKSYCFLNQPLSKKDYHKKVKEVQGSYLNHKKFLKEFNNLAKKLPRKENNNLKNNNVKGDYVFESKGCSNVFEASFCENVHNAFSVKVLKDSSDVIGHGRNSELLLECVGVGAGSLRIIGGWLVESSQDVLYSFATKSSIDCIGCDGIKDGKYMILNKRYKKEEYEKIKKHIIDELKTNKTFGLYFPLELGFFAYNETIGQDNFPLSKKEAILQGFRWQEDFQKTVGKETLRPENIPDHIKDVSESILKETLTCVSCKRNYKLISSELQFYQKMNLPIPRECFFCRHINRLYRRGSMKSIDRECDKCQKKIKTNYSLELAEAIYCEKCYQKEVI